MGGGRVDSAGHGIVGDEPDFHRWLLASSPDGLCLIDGQGRFTWLNERLAEMLGRSPETLLGQSFAEVLDDEGKVQMQDHLDTMNAGHPGESNVEVLMLRPDGTELWSLASWVPFHTPDGRRLGWLHRVTEHTERRRLVEELRLREQQLAAAQEIAHLGGWEWDAAERLLIWSDELCRIHGIEPGTFSGDWQDAKAFVHPDDRDLMTAAVLEGVSEDQPLAWEVRMLRADGELRWIRGQCRVTRAVDGSVVRILGTTQDITELTATERVARRATRGLRLLQEVASRANASASLDEAIDDCLAPTVENTGWRPFAAFTRDPVSGDLHVRPLEPGVPDVLPDHQLAEEAFAHGRYATRPLPDDDRSLVVLPLGHDGTIACVVQIVADATVPDDEAATLALQVVELLNQVARREQTAVELAQARDTAMDASRQKSDFLATMSHEIRTPMNGVIGLTELLLGTALDEQQLRLADNLRGAGHTLLAIINDILDLSKIESGKLELESERLDVHDVLDRTVSILAGSAAERGLALVAWCEPEVPTSVLGDAMRLGQVISNLASNAVKFTDAGEVTIRVSSEPLATDDPRGADDVLLRVEVTDTGIGFAEELQDGLFEAFSQADRSTTRRHGGTGLGLAICVRLVEAMGGDLGVTSAPGVGSTFWFTAPLSATPRDLDDTAHDLDGVRALVVEPHAVAARAVETQLRGWGMRVDTVSDVAEVGVACATAAAAQEPVEVALVDTPADRAGLEALVRGLGAHGARPALVLVSDAPGASAESLTVSGATASLTRPVRHRDLADAVRTAVGRGARPVTLRGPARVARAGTRVLVVEDNPVNQIVARGYLESLGIDVEVADDGVEAVARLAAGDGEPQIDAVLMDCRMPRLDGFAATRAIRATETGTRMPIIAMTASALPSEREHCFESGMDDFLPKPVERHHLERALGRWVPHLMRDVAPAAQRDQGPASEEGPEADPGPRPVLDPDRVADLRDLVKDGIDFFDRTRASFLSRIDAQLEELADAAARGEAEQTTALAHQLKGSATNLGLTRLGDAAAAVEDVARAGSGVDLAVGVESLRREARAAVEALAACSS